MLAIGLEPLDPRKPEIDGRNVGDVLRGPDRDDARQRQRRRVIDARDPPVREGRPHDAHMQLTGERDVGREPAATRHQRPVFEARDGTADEPHHRPRISVAAARTALMMF